SGLYAGALQSSLGKEPDRRRDRLPDRRPLRDSQAGGHPSMTPGLLLGLFLFVMAAVSAAGYIFVLRPSRKEAPEVEIPAGISLEQQDLSPAQAAFLGAFRLLGEAVPNSGKQHAELRGQLVTAGYRWPSAVAIFLGIKAATALLFGIAAVWGALANRAE